MVGYVGYKQLKDVSIQISVKQYYYRYRQRIKELSEAGPVRYIYLNKPEQMESKAWSVPSAVPLGPNPVSLNSGPVLLVYTYLLPINCPWDLIHTQIPQVKRWSLFTVVTPYLFDCSGSNYNTSAAVLTLTIDKQSQIIRNYLYH